ncbi:nitroreductase family protein [Aeribacillus alveayuensis]|jgi:nitroreductase|uniref:nitroreductase family protein n=1 Tax=Aeribacillus alveayuensis TaxID=279215 RepID=UPI0005D128F6|nr:nitroreductase family protein [Bacillus alveayuensis]
MNAVSAGNDLIQLMKDRTSIRHFDPNATIDESEVKEILEIAGKAPSAWNLQHWHFVVFHSQEAKERLLPIAYNQSQVINSSVVIAVLGDLQANKKTDAVYDPLVQQGFMTTEVKQTLSNQIDGAYQDQQFARDSAFSNASLAAMQLMLAAKAKDYDSCAIGGFNKEQFVKEFNISDRFVPIMLIAIGKAAKPAHKSSRLNLDELSTWL